MRATTKWARWIVALATAAFLVACGGGDEVAAPPQTPRNGYATLGAAGGEVLAEDGARITVPPEALGATTTLRIAKNASGAPALPPQLVPAGDVYALTPHGTSFGAQAARISVPAPTLSLQANQALRLARVQPGGEWEVLLDSGVENGELVASLNGFSYYQPVVVTYLLPIASAAPLTLSVALSCGAQDCDNLRGPVDYTFTVTTNNGALPEGCQSPELAIAQGTGGLSGSLAGSLPITGGTLTRRAAPPASFNGDHRVYVTAMLRCQGSTWSYSRAASMRWRSVPASSYAITPNLDCGTFNCNAISDNRAVITYSIVSNGVVPTNCAFPRIAVRMGWIHNDGYLITESTFYLPIEGGSYTREYSAPLNRTQALWSPALECSGTSHYELPRKSAYFARPAAPTLTLPQPVLVLAGQTASFDSLVRGVPRPAIRWQTRPANSTGSWTDVTDGQGADGMHFTTAALGTAQNGQQYRVVASNSLGTVESVVVTVSVSEQPVAPTITTQPAALNVSAGNEAVFVAAANGTEALNWQWLFNGLPIRGANAPVLKVNAADASRQGNYSVEVSNGRGKTTSQPAQLTVTPGAPAALAPAIVTQPAAVTVNAGNTATFAVGVAGSSPMSFQWRKDGSDIAGATAAAYTIATAASGDAGAYSVAVNNGAGTVTSSAATLSVIAAPAQQSPAISTQPATAVVLPGGSATLAVAASGTAPLAYQWSRNGTPVAGATGAVLNLANITGLDAGSYTVSVSNSAGNVASAAAQLILVGAPAITQQPAAVSAAEGSTATFSVSATGDALRYQWTRNNVGIPDATSASYTTPVLTMADHGAVFGVIVYNGAGLVMSQSAALTVTQAAVAPSFGSSPASTLAAVGGDARFEVSVLGAPTPGLQWQSSMDAGASWVDIAGATSPVLTVANVAMADDGRFYRAVATNSAGSSTSTAVPLRVCLSGPVDVGNAPSTVSGKFCPQTAPTARVASYNPDVVEIFGWLESGMGSTQESMLLSFNTATNQVVDVSFYLNDPQRLLTWLCAAGSSSYVPCNGVVLDRATGQVTFNNATIGAEQGSNAITLNGRLSFTPF